MEHAFTYITLGAYAFLCFDIVVKMALRILNYEDYTQWQRHLFACWGILMGFIFFQLVWDATAYRYNIPWQSTANLNVRDFSLLVIQLCGLTLWTLTTHKTLSYRRCIGHLLPYTTGALVICLLRPYLPEIRILYYLAQAAYCVVMLYKLIRNIRIFNIHLQQTYADTHRRNLNWMINLIWLFVVILLLYGFFGWIQNSLEVYYYPIAMSVWYYINWNIVTLRETKILEDALTENGELAEEEVAVQESTSSSEKKEPTTASAAARSSMRELTKKRIEASLEEICLTKRLYLNSDLTINDLASELNTNRTYISQYFSEHHTTFLKYINDLRVEYAMYQIKNTTLKMSDIMESSGFLHTETFKRAFMSRYNCDPREVPRTNVPSGKSKK